MTAPRSPIADPLAVLARWQQATPNERARLALAVRLDLEHAEPVSATLLDEARRDRQRALGLAHAFVRLSRAGGDDAALAVAWRTRAGILRSVRRLRESLRDSRAAAATFLDLRLPVEWARTMIGMVDVLATLGQLDEAIRLAGRARSILDRAGDARRAARLDANLANLLFRQDRFTRALARYATAERTFERLGHEVDLALVRFNRANALLSLDRFRDALPLLEASARAWESLGMAASLAQCRIVLGEVRFQLGRLTDALADWQRASDAALALGDDVLHATAETNVAHAELRLNRAAAAAARLDAVIPRLEALTLRDDEATALRLRASADVALGRPAEACASFARAARLLHALGRPVRARWVELSWAFAELEAGLRERGLRRLRSAVTAGRRYDAPALEAEARLALAERAAIEGSPASRRLLAAAIAPVRRSELPWLRLRVRRLAAVLAARDGRDRAARVAFERAWDIAESLRAALPAQSQRTDFLRDKLGLFEDAIEAAARSAEPDATRWGLAWSERAQVGASPDTAAPPPGTDGARDERETQASIERLREDLHWLDERERAGRLRSAGEARAGAAGRWREQRVRVARQLERLVQRLALQRALRAGAQRSRGRPAPHDPRAGLRPEERALAYFAGERALYVFVIGPDGVSQRRLGAPPAEVRGHVEALRRTWNRWRVAPAGPRAVEALRDTVSRRLDALHAALVAPVLDDLGPGPVAVVPHGWLHGLPFHALEAGSTPLAAGREVRYLLPFATRPPVPCSAVDRRPLVVGVDSVESPGAEAEAHEVARRHPDAVVLLGAEATRAEVRRHWARASIVHVAAHGGLDPDDPRSTGLRLADGLWSVHDIKATPTPAELVVLSACRTGEAQSGAGDAGVGLVPALLAGGVPQVVASLWSVDDAVTRHTMCHLHAALAGGDRPSGALATAWRFARIHHRAPYHWAPFALMGARYWETSNA